MSPLFGRVCYERSLVLYWDVVMENELLVRIQYIVSGESFDSGALSAIRAHASCLGLGGSASLTDCGIEMTLSGAPTDIGDFLTEFHLKLPDGVSVRQITPVMKTVVQSSDTEFIVHNVDSDTSAQVPVEEPGKLGYDAIRAALLAGESARITIRSSDYLALPPVKESSDGDMPLNSDCVPTLLFASMDSLFEHCHFNAAAVKGLVARPDRPARVRLRPETKDRLPAEIADSDEVFAMIADPGISDEIFSSEDERIDFLILIPV